MRHVGILLLLLALPVCSTGTAPAGTPASGDEPELVVEVLGASLVFTDVRSSGVGSASARDSGLLPAKVLLGGGVEAPAGSILTASLSASRPDAMDLFIWSDVDEDSSTPDLLVHAELSYASGGSSQPQLTGRVLPWAMRHEGQITLNLAAAPGMPGALRAAFREGIELSTLSGNGIYFVELRANASTGLELKEAEVVDWDLVRTERVWDAVRDTLTDDEISADLLETGVVRTGLSTVVRLLWPKPKPYVRRLSGNALEPIPSPGALRIRWSGKLRRSSRPAISARTRGLQRRISADLDLWGLLGEDSATIPLPSVPSVPDRETPAPDATVFAGLAAAPEDPMRAATCASAVFAALPRRKPSTLR